MVNSGPAIAVSALAFSPDGKMLAVGGYQEVPLWDLAQGKLAKRLGAGRLGDLDIPVAITVTKQVPVGFRPFLVLNGTRKTDKETSTRIVPAIPIKVLAP